MIFLTLFDGGGTAYLSFSLVDRGGEGIGRGREGGRFTYLKCSKSRSL